MGIWHSVFGVIGLIVLITVGVSGFGWYSVFAVVIPYAAILFFICGFIYRIVRWASAPVPFSIATVSGQQKSLSWIKASSVDSPSTTLGVIGRLALETLVFRSLVKNEKVELQEPQRLLFKASTLLWLGAMVFHWSFLVIVLRHLRFFLEPVPSAIVTLQRIDSILQGLLPILYMTDLQIVLALTYLFVRRVIYPQIRYISLVSDYFVLLVVAAIAVTGILMRLIYKVDLFQVKSWIMSMLSFHPALPQGVNVLFYIHLCFVSLLLVYFPLSKLMHMPGIFLSPTRNLRNISRNHRTINPWNPAVKVHTYEEYEDEFRNSMKEAGLPVEKG